MSKFITNEFIIIFFWIGLWGIIETTVDHFISNYKIKIVIYFIILLISIFILKRNKIKKHEDLNTLDDSNK